MNLPEVGSLQTVEDVMRVRASLPSLKAGDPLQGYKWALSCRLRSIRSRLAGSLPPSLVRRLVKEAGEVCPECNEWMGAGAKRWPSVDHIVALANGGTNIPDNLRVICNRCNSKKADRA